MSEVKAIQKLTNDAIEAKASELTIEHKCKVHPLVFEHEGEQIVGYLKEPIRIVKMRALDKIMQSTSSAGEELLMACLITGESDKRIMSEDQQYDNIYIGACLAATALIEISVNAYKKK